MIMITRSLPLLSLLLLITSTAVGTPAGIAIRSVEARLFYQHTGKLSAPITGSESLWNTIIGEGEAEEPSSATLVSVVVKGTPGEYNSSWVVELVVTGARGRVVSKQKGDVGVLSATGEYHVPFWLPNTGCERLTIRARMKSARTWVEKVVPFACGE